MSEPGQQLKLAIFIDFENVEISSVRQYGEFDLSLLLDRIRPCGRASIRRAYGDWSSSQMAAYRDVLREHAVELVHLYSYSYQQGGKNRADIRLAIDVMEVVFTQHHIDIVVIVSGDSDFSSLMSRIREYGKYTIGVGVKASTSDLLVKACDEFIFYDDLLPQHYESLKPEAARNVTEAAESPLLYAAPVSVPAQPVATAGQLLPPPVAEVALMMENSPPGPMLNRPVLQRVSFTGPLPGSAAIPPDAGPVSETPDFAALSGVAQLRSFLTFIGLRPLPPVLRRKALAELIRVAPGCHFLKIAVDRIRSGYNFNVMWQPADLREAARLACRAEIFEFGPERPSLASYIQRVRQPDPILAAQQADQACLRKLLEAGLTLNATDVAALLFSSEEEADAAELLNDLVAKRLAVRVEGRYRAADGGAAIRVLDEEPLAVVREDLRRTSLESAGDISRAAAEELFAEASDRSVQDFASKARAGLQALKILEELIRRGEPGNGSDELLWWAAGYCCSSAGQQFRAHNYQAARRYYLAFFWIMQEGELAWEQLTPLLRPMQAYYWATATHEHGIFLRGLAQQTLEEVFIELLETLSENQYETLRGMAVSLAQVNAPLVRSLASQIERSYEDEYGDAAAGILRSSLELVTGQNRNQGR
ncbi:MAG: NYN domain-containing protein [Blastocatellia bacterium]